MDLGLHANDIKLVISTEIFFFNLFLYCIYSLNQSLAKALAPTALLLARMPMHTHHSVEKDSFMLT